MKNRGAVKISDNKFQPGGMLSFWLLYLGNAPARSPRRERSRSSPRGFYAGSPATNVKARASGPTGLALTECRFRQSARSDGRKDGKI